MPSSAFSEAQQLQRALGVTGPGSSQLPSQHSLGCLVLCVLSVLTPPNIEPTEKIVFLAIKNN